MVCSYLVVGYNIDSDLGGDRYNDSGIGNGAFDSSENCFFAR